MTTKATPYLATMLRDAAELIERGDASRAAWRVADAGGLLRAELEATGAWGNLAGLGEATGNGYRLPIHEEEASV